jgi:hypothetical protein
MILSALVAFIAFMLARQSACAAPLFCKVLHHMALCCGIVLCGHLNNLAYPSSKENRRTTECVDCTVIAS